MINVEVFSDNPLWKNKIKKTPFFFNKLLENFPKKYFFKKKKINMSVLLSNNRNIKKLNKKFRNKDKATDVLSFPLKEKKQQKKETYLGDIIISYQFMNKPKHLTNIEFKNNTIKTFIHGFLHLLNYDHIKLKDFKKMKKEEDKIYNYLEKRFAKFN